MKNKFSSYFNKTSNETIEEMLKNGLISFDTNILLNLYSKSSENVENFFETLEHEEVNPRIRLPYHITKEFINKREKKVLSEINKVNDEMGNNKEILASVKGIMEGIFDSSIHKQNLDEENIKKFNENIEEIKKFIDSKEFLKDKFKNLNDYNFEKIGELFDGKVGERLSPEEYEDITAEWKIRCDLYIPPGYEDNEREGFNKYGGLVVWKELIKFSKDNEKDMIFVLNDKRKDWKVQLPNNNLVPHHELICEFNEKTDGQKIYFLEYEEFMNKMGKLLRIDIINNEEQEDKPDNEVQNRIIKDFPVEINTFGRDSELFVNKDMKRLKTLYGKLMMLYNSIVATDDIDMNKLKYIKNIMEELEYIARKIDNYPLYKNAKMSKLVVKELLNNAIMFIDGSIDKDLDELIHSMSSVISSIQRIKMYVDEDDSLFVV